MLFIKAHTSSMFLSTAAIRGAFHALEIISSGTLVIVFCQQFKLPYFIEEFLSAGLQLLTWWSIFQKYFWTHDRIFYFWRRILIAHIKSIFQCPSQITIA
jgi:hypothetical protein